MKQALMLCGGEARRLRPYSYYFPKACMPFLNLPLLSLAWFYLDHLNVSRFFLNSYCFPEKLKSTVDFLSQNKQKTKIFIEEKPLGAAGTLYQLKNHLQKQKYFFYINGDSLFFPSDLDQLLKFEEDFLNTGVEASFFVAPLAKEASPAEALWSDSNKDLKFVGNRQDACKKHDTQKLSPYYFSGLALLKSSVLENLKPTDFHFFEDFIHPLLSSQKRFKLFVDPGARVLEAGDKKNYIKSMEFCLNLLFLNENLTRIKEETRNASEVFKNILEQCMSHFDPKDQIVGLTNGKKWSQKLGHPLLAPESVKGLPLLELEGPAVLGSHSQLIGKSGLKHAILGSHTVWKGELKNEIIFKTVL